VRLSVITPSLNQLSWLKLCVGSVAGQGQDIEHIVQDAGSTDGTREWLRQDSRVKPFVEHDEGMYDAINRGLRRATGDVLGYLNCDEQYLPGAIGWVIDFFEQNPSVEMLFGDVVVVNSAGEYVCDRKVKPPQKFHTWTCHLSTLSCATFFRRRLIDEEKLFFDPSYRCNGDGEWMIRVLSRSISMAALEKFTSAFVLTGENQSQSSCAVEESLRLRKTAPRWAQMLKPLWIANHRMRRFFAGAYTQKPFDYAIFTPGSANKRVSFHVAKPCYRYPNQIKGQPNS
jgi:glycosyltransferase involved in cell wall biosynthesis